MRSAAITQPEVRDRILQEAERLFRTHGYAKTAVADVAAACEMSPANVYRFFESKAAMSEAITELLLKRMEDLAQSIARERRSATERLKKLIAECHRYTCEQYLKESQVHDMVTRAMDEQWAVIDAHIQRLHGIYRRVIEEGVRAGEFAADDLDNRLECVFTSILPFCHPQIVAEKFADDHGRQAILMGEFLARALKH